MKPVLLMVVSLSLASCTIGCNAKDDNSVPTRQEGGSTSSSKPYREYTASDIVDMTQADLLHAIQEYGFHDKGVLVFTEKLKKIAPEMNEEIGIALKQDFTFDWYVTTMLALKMSEQQFRALDMMDVGDEVGAAVESLESAWSESDLHEILNISFYAGDLDAVLNAIAENMPEEQQQVRYSRLSRPKS